MTNSNSTSQVMMGNERRDASCARSAAFVLTMLLVSMTPMIAQSQTFSGGYRVSEVPFAATVSRPVLTYVRVGNQVHAAMIVGCGGELGSRDNNGLALGHQEGGRCVQILKVADGSVIRTFHNGNGIRNGDQMSFPMVGSPSVYPAIGLAPASRAYLGDAMGRLWRIDMRSANPNQWEMSIAWPIRDSEDSEFYRIGREITARPAVFLRENGQIGVVFGTGEAYRNNASVPHILSLSDSLKLTDNNRLQFEAELVWKMPLRQKETLTGEVNVRAGGAYFTTAENGPFPDGTSLPRGRLYGVDATRTSDDYLTTDGRIQNVVPILPTLTTQNGQNVTDAVAIRLPSGRLAYGLALVLSPSCRDDEEATTEVILNLAAGKGGTGTGGGAARIERKTGELVPGNLDEDFLTEGQNDVAIKLTSPAVGDRPRVGSSSAPFSRRVLYWGSSYLQ
ncbi:MAG: hypothetical protein ACON3Z_14435 [Bradymonadia bacterium]